MTSEQNGEAAEKMLKDMVRDADEYYGRLKGEHITRTRVRAGVTGFAVWFGVFVALGLGGYFTLSRDAITGYLLWAFLTALVTGVVAGLTVYYVWRRRGLEFKELGVLLERMKGGRTSSEDGLRLMDLMHQAVLSMRKQRLDAAFAYGIGAFILVTVVGLNAGFGALAGVVTYLYFRFEALRDYEREDEKYEVSKKEVLLSL
jgi:hypothetical protein